MRRGEVWIADLEPVLGSESNKRRPVIIVSNDHSNTAVRTNGRGTVTVVPVTSNVSRVFTFQVLLRTGTAGLRKESKAQAEQVRSIDVARLQARLGQLPAGELARVDAALRKHLSLD